MKAGKWEDYFYPGTHVLKNKPDIRDPAILEKFERGVTALRIQEIRENPIHGKFDYAHLQALHKHIFKDVYEWAGQTRTVNIAKGSGADRTHFAIVKDIPEQGYLAQEIVKEANYGRGMNSRELAQTMSEVYAVINMMHPFREGNGRSAREFMNSLASQSGHQLNFTKVNQEIWNEAAKESAYANLEPIRDVFSEIMVVNRAVSFDRLPPVEALAKHPELDGAIKALVSATENNLDETSVRNSLSRQLHRGMLIDGATVTESAAAIARSVEYRNLMLRDADKVGGKLNGEVVAVSSHHTLLKIGEMVAVRFENKNLDRQVYPGERITVDYGIKKSMVLENNHDSGKEHGKDFQKEITR